MIIKFFIFELLCLLTKAENFESCKVTHDEPTKSTNVYCSNIKVDKADIPLASDLPTDHEFRGLLFQNSSGKINEDSLENLRDINSLIIVGSKFDEFVLPSLPKLRFLSIMNSTLPTLEGAFKNVQLLDRLNIINNNIRLDDNSFKGLKSLSSLRIHQQEITLSETIFRDLKNLVRLFLVKDNIEKIPYGVFQRNTDLVVLSLDDNPIKDIEQGALDPLKNLQSLKLLNSNLEKFNIDSIKELKDLSIISVPARAIRELDLGQLLKNNPKFANFYFSRKDTECSEVKSLQTKINEMGSSVSIAFRGPSGFEKSC